MFERNKRFAWLNFFKNYASDDEYSSSMRAFRIKMYYTFALWLRAVYMITIFVIVIFTSLSWGFDSLDVSIQFDIYLRVRNNMLRSHLWHRYYIIIRESNDESRNVTQKYISRDTNIFPRTARLFRCSNSVYSTHVNGIISRYLYKMKNHRNVSTSSGRWVVTVKQNYVRNQIIFWTVGWFIFIE